MKKIIYLAVTVFFFSCGNDDNASNGSESSTVTPPVENVDGNIPDSTNNINLNQPLPIDSSNLTNDSTPRR